MKIREHPQNGVHGASSNGKGVWITVSTPKGTTYSSDYNLQEVYVFLFYGYSQGTFDSTSHKYINVCSKREKFVFSNF